MKLLPPTLILLACIMLSACSFHSSLGNPEAQDQAARAEIAQIKQLLVSELGPQIQKLIADEIAKATGKVSPKLPDVPK